METTDPSSSTASVDIKGFARQWHYRPPVPVQVSPLYAWPPRPMACFHWVRERWFTLAENSILVGLATLCWFAFQPSMEEARTLSPGWIGQIYLRNLILIIGVAGGLHLYFHRYRKQKSDLKYDPRELKAKSRLFTFNSQVWDNIFWTLASGVTVWTGYEVLMFWAMANGYAPVLNPVDTPGLVCGVAVRHADVDILPLLLDPPVAALATALQACPLSASPQHQCWTVVRLLHAPDRTCDVSFHPVLIHLVRGSASDPHPLSHATSGADRGNLAYRVSRACW